MLATVVGAARPNNYMMITQQCYVMIMMMMVATEFISDAHNDNVWKSTTTSITTECMQHKYGIA